MIMKKYASPEFEMLNMLTTDVITMSVGGEAGADFSTQPGVSVNDLFVKGDLVCSLRFRIARKRRLSFFMSVFLKNQSLFLIDYKF